MPPSEPKLLLIPIETKAREFQAKVFFASRALERGYDVWLGSAREMFKHLTEFPRATMVAHHVGFGFSAFLPLAYYSGFRIIAWDEESIVVKNDDFYVRERVPEKHITLVNQFYTRGRGDLKAILNHYPFMEGKLFPTGNPRLDILRPEYMAYHVNKDIPKTTKKRITINSRFSHSNPGLMTKEAFRKGQLSRFKHDAKAYAYKEGYMNYTDMLFERFINMVEQITQVFPEYEFILRPHPSEDETIWRNLAKTRNNLTITKEHTATAWSLNSDATIHNGCTTAIESSLLGCNVIAYTPCHSKEYDIQQPNNVSQKIDTIEELLNTLKSIKKPNQQERQKLAQKTRTHLSQYITGLKNKTASDIILDALDKDNTKRILSAKDYICLAQHHIINQMRKLKRAIVYTYRHTNIEEKKEAYFRIKFPSLDKEEIQDALKTAGVNHPKINQIRKDWFSIERGEK